ncbi:hypothetical protein GCM10028861_11980 [Flavobacterium koreense]
MNPIIMRANFKSIVLRVLLLVLPIASILLWYFLTFDEHKYCTPTKHRHVDGFLGIVFLIIIWFFVWLFIIMIEMLYKNLIRKNK